MQRSTDRSLKGAVEMVGQIHIYLYSLAIVVYRTVNVCVVSRVDNEHIQIAILTPTVRSTIELRGSIHAVSRLRHRHDCLNEDFNPSNGGGGGGKGGYRFGDRVCVIIIAPYGKSL